MLPMRSGSPPRLKQRSRTHVRMRSVWASTISPQVARSPARRAVKAITLGLAAPPGPEREVALKGASTTLKELALYYLPVIDPAAPTLIATRKELP